MEYKNEHQRQMAMLEAALPYMPPNGRRAIQLYLQANSFLALANGQSDEVDSSLEAAEFEQNSSGNSATHLQDMLVRLQEFLTPKEASMTNTVLNILQAGKIMQGYHDFLHHQPDNKDMVDLTANGINPEKKPGFKEFLLSQLNPEQKILFEQLQNIMYNE